MFVRREGAADALSGRQNGAAARNEENGGARAREEAIKREREAGGRNGNLSGRSGQVVVDAVFKGNIESMNVAISIGGIGEGTHLGRVVVIVVVVIRMPRMEAVEVVRRGDDERVVGVCVASVVSRAGTVVVVMGECELMTFVIAVYAFKAYVRGHKKVAAIEAASVGAPDITVGLFAELSTNVSCAVGWLDRVCRGKVIVGVVLVCGQCS